jgi:hypothetical protein
MVLNHSEFTGAYQANRWTGSADYVASEATGRLLQFHTPENFGADLGGKYRGLAPLNPRAPTLKWEWVEEAVPADRRRLVLARYGRNCESRNV